MNSKKSSLSMLRTTVLYFFLLGLNLTSAQNTENVKDDYKTFNAGAHIKNMHIWHGFVVHPGAMFATNLEYNSRNKKFTFGVWGGAGLTTVNVVNKDSGENVDAHYQEFSIYTLYRVSDKFFIEAVTHNNYTGVEERADKLRYWSYDKTQGYNFVDINFGYNGSLKDSWTHYFEVKSKVWERDDYKLPLFANSELLVVNM